MDFLIQTSLNTVSVTSNFIYFVINVFFQLSPDNPLQPDQAIYGFNNNVIQNDVKAIVDIKNLTKSNASERLYDVKVAVYDSKASLDDIFNDKDPVVTMTGSMGY